MSYINRHIHTSDQPHVLAISKSISLCKRPRLIAGIHEVQTDKHTKIRCIYICDHGCACDNLLQKVPSIHCTAQAQTNKSCITVIWGP